jgi:hypothetical protein
MLTAIVVSYAVIIGFTQSSVGGPGRVLLLGYLLGLAVRQRGGVHLGAWVWVGTVIALVVTGWFTLFGSARVATAIVGGLSFLIILVVISTIAANVRSSAGVDVSTVLGVLCIYLLLALLFASLHQFLAVFQANYLGGVTGTPTASDLLYFSVITMATVGFGDITPVSEIARAVTVVEALVGQLYLVSVVAGVVGGFRAGGRAPPQPEPPDNPRST